MEFHQFTRKPREFNYKWQIFHCQDSSLKGTACNCYWPIWVLTRDLWYHPMITKLQLLIQHPEVCFDPNHHPNDLRMLRPGPPCVCFKTKLFRSSETRTFSADPPPLSCWMLQPPATYSQCWRVTVRWTRERVVGGSWGQVIPEFLVAYYLPLLTLALVMTMLIVSNNTKGLAIGYNIGSNNGWFCLLLSSIN